MKLWTCFALFTLLLFAVVCQAAPPARPACNCAISGPCVCGAICNCDDAIVKVQTVCGPKGCCAAPVVVIPRPTAEPPRFVVSPCSTDKCRPVVQPVRRLFGRLR